MKSGVTRLLPQNSCRKPGRKHRPEQSTRENQFTSLKTAQHHSAKKHRSSLAPPTSSISIQPTHFRRQSPKSFRTTTHSRHPSNPTQAVGPCCCTIRFLKPISQTDLSNIRFCGASTPLSKKPETRRNQPVQASNNPSQTNTGIQPEYQEPVPKWVRPSLPFPGGLTALGTGSRENCKNCYLRIPSRDNISKYLSESTERR